MASRIMHLAIASELKKSISVNDENRFKLGSVMPDAVIDGNSHFKEKVSKGGKKVYNFTKFRELFIDRIKSDELYLGYYLHLVEDAVFRRFVYADYKWNPTIPGNVERLHNDYALLNTYVVERYGLKDNVVLPDGIESEEIAKMFKFGLVDFLLDMKQDFKPYSKGSIFFFTTRMADEYISKTVPVCLKEIKSLHTGGTLLNEHDWAWETNG